MGIVLPPIQLHSRCIWIGVDRFMEHYFSLHYRAINVVVGYHRNFVRRPEGQH
jgi:hypothetical protein